MEKEYLAWMIGFFTTCFVIFIGFWAVWYTDYSQRRSIYRKRFFDANGIRPSDKYIKDINKFLDIIITIYCYDNYGQEITESQFSKLEDLYEKVFLKGVKVLYKLNYAIDACTGYEKSYIDKAMKQIRAEYKSWQKFNSTKEIY